MRSFFKRLGNWLKTTLQVSRKSAPIGLPNSPYSDELSSNKVFISYTNADYEPVRKIVNELESQHFQVWFAPDKLRAGDQLTNRISTGLKQANFVLIMISQASINAPWVEYEMTTAIALRNEGTPVEVIPILLNRVEIPVSIKNVLGIDMSSSNNFDTGLQQLVQRLRGEIVTTKSYVKEFLEFVNGLIIISEELSSRLSKASVTANLNNWGTHWYGRGPETWSEQERAKVEEQVRKSRDFIEAALSVAELDNSDQVRIWAAIDDGFEPPVITLTQKQEVITTARLAGEELIEFTADIHNISYKRDIRDWMIKVSFDVGLAQAKYPLIIWTKLNGELISLRTPLLRQESSLNSKRPNMNIQGEMRMTNYSIVVSNSTHWRLSPRCLFNSENKPENGN